MSNRKRYIKLGLVLCALLPAHAEAAPCKVSISPAGGSVFAGGVIQFTAIVEPSGCSQLVSWTATAGSLGGGLFTAPSASPGPKIVTVRARQLEAPYASGIVTVTVRYSQKSPVKPIKPLK